MNSVMEAVSNGLALVSIPVADQDRAKQFYSEVLGFPLLADNGFRPDARWVQLGIPGTTSAITLVTWFPSMPPGSVRGLVLLTENLETASATLVSRGLNVSKIQSAPWGNYLTFSDPDGNGWVLQQAR